MGAFLGRCQTSNTLDLSSTKNSCAFYEYTVDQWMVTFKIHWIKFSKPNASNSKESFRHLGAIHLQADKLAEADNIGPRPIFQAGINFETLNRNRNFEIETLNRNFEASIGSY